MDTNNMDTNNINQNNNGVNQQYGQEPEPAVNGQPDSTYAQRDGFTRVESYQNEGFIQSGSYYQNNTDAQGSGYSQCDPYQSNGYTNGNNTYQNYNNYQPYGNVPPYMDNQLELEEPVKVSEWVLSMVLMMIPCVNIIMMFVWAFSSTEKKSKSNFFKAYLIFFGIMMAVMTLLWAVMIFIIAALA